MSIKPTPEAHVFAMQKGMFSMVMAMPPVSTPSTPDVSSQILALCNTTFPADAEQASVSEVDISVPDRSQVALVSVISQISVKFSDTDTSASVPSLGRREPNAPPKAEESFMYRNKVANIHAATVMSKEEHCELDLEEECAYKTEIDHIMDDSRSSCSPRNLSWLAFTDAARTERPAAASVIL